MPEKLIPFDINIARKHPERIRFISSSGINLVISSAEFSKNHMILYWNGDNHSSVYRLPTLAESHPGFKLAVATKKIMVQGFIAKLSGSMWMGYRAVIVNSQCYCCYLQYDKNYEKVGEPFEIEIEDIEV